MIAFGTKVRFRSVHSGRLAGIVVGRTREAEPRYDIRVEKTIHSDVPASLIEELSDASLF